jgi:hypothetical protein
MFEGDRRALVVDSFRRLARGHDENAAAHSTEPGRYGVGEVLEYQERTNAAFARAAAGLMSVADPTQIDQIVRVTMAGQINDDLRDDFADIRGNVANEFVAVATESGEWPALRALLPGVPRKWYRAEIHPGGYWGCRSPGAGSEALGQALAGFEQPAPLPFVARRMGL